MFKGLSCVFLDNYLRLEFLIALLLVTLLLNRGDYRDVSGLLKWKKIFFKYCSMGRKCSNMNMVIGVVLALKSYLERANTPQYSPPEFDSRDTTSRCSLATGRFWKSRMFGGRPVAFTLRPVAFNLRPVAFAQSRILTGRSVAIIE
ncbi:hypothetical protein L3X38_010516 [Prunus dulcis]|uniref:Uncharacterized protein n=1 Tax=Prunus dulcis TaxID=3755 RepID=A0AAD4ZE46_PRUDU|nr:hypothetical protein L3X38_010516 [Prunus dulcis]